MKELKYYQTSRVPTKYKHDFINEKVEEEMENFVGTKKEIKEKEKEIYDKIEKENIHEINSLYNEYERKRKEDLKTRRKEFENDLAIKCGVVNHPKLNKLWNLIYSLEHRELCLIKRDFENYSKLLIDL